MSKVDDTARKFLGTDKPAVVQGQTVSEDGKKKQQDYALKDFTDRAGRMTEELHRSLIKLRKELNLSDEEAIGGIALLCINLRESFGVQDGEKPTAAEIKARLAQFDNICAAMQKYYDRETGRS